MTADSSIRVEREGNVCWLTLNRPEKRNSMGLDFFQDLLGHFKACDQDPAVRVVVIRAEGGSFCAGIDVFDLAGLIQGEGAEFREDLRRKILQLQESMNAIEKCRKPVIAAVHGYCIGGGVDLASACDIRMASRHAIFAIRETRIGIVADLGTLQRLPQIVGQGWFRELALTGRDFSAEEALKMGFITRLCEDQEDLHREAKKLAEEIACLSPLAVQGVKDVILYSRDYGVSPGLEYVAQKNAAILQSQELMEMLKTFMAKRAGSPKKKEKEMKNEGDRQ